MRVYLDANFFISGFSDRPKDVTIVKKAADSAGMELWITRQVFQELRWYLRREAENIVQIDETLNKDIKSFISSINRPESSLPQANDMSLILGAMRSKGSKIVTSDLKLLNTIQDLNAGQCATVLSEPGLCFKLGQTIRTFGDMTICVYI